MKNTKLISIRKSKKISQADVATYLKISQTQYQKREAGKIKITAYEWEKIAKLLDIDLDEINVKNNHTVHEKSLAEEVLFLKERIKKLELKINLNTSNNMH
ncbi:MULTISPECIES: helix-turn-helix transcriptional regulator [unclassified Chryseobacterium]|uniref:helix-turn-helix domain-containing protein n=1 Tax=unclassified Chryseobacterium TaxID=2593645 RepID=UPI002269F355|nr:MULTISPECIES: helix-turn-helix transcriptional regulator [unclassified Chryseobacterium]